MKKTECQFQDALGSVERLKALAEGQCRRCGLSETQDTMFIQALEVCADEFLLGFGDDQVVFDIFPLCPACHEEHHLDVDGRHNPCQNIARQSFEHLPTTRPDRPD